MNGFSAKHIAEQTTLGEKIAARRTALGYDQTQAARMVGLPLKYIIALEQGTYQDIPGIVYARQYIRTYNSLLGFSFDELLCEIDKEFRTVDEQKTQVLVHRRVVTKAMATRLPLVSSLRHIVIGVGVCSMVVVLIVSVVHFFAPPALEISTPQEGIIVHEGAVEVVGWTSPESNVTINGQLITKTNEGSFNESVVVHTGVNTLTIVAQKKHGWARTIERKVLAE